MEYSESTQRRATVRERLRSGTTRRVGIAVAALGLVAAATGGAALAAPTAAPARATAPYAQASALVNADGSVDRAKGVKAVTLGSAGRFCVQLEDSRLNLTELTPVATPTWDAYPAGEIFVHSRTAAECGNAADTLLVVTTNRDGGGVHKPFFLLVP
ncbi:hypothetical protein [Streptomyces sp. NPDC006267]|uniref:hypothetical protein n=1 Tax=Streptomyces sp. NPDC006267 TaxID=3157173 RepID=UPI0033A6B2B4